MTVATGKWTFTAKRGTTWRIYVRKLPPCFHVVLCTIKASEKCVLFPESYLFISYWSVHTFICMYAVHHTLPWWKSYKKNLRLLKSYLCRPLLKHLQEDSPCSLKYVVISRKQLTGEREPLLSRINPLICLFSKFKKNTGYSGCSSTITETPDLERSKIRSSRPASATQQIQIQTLRIYHSRGSSVNWDWEITMHYCKFTNYKNPPPDVISSHSDGVMDKRLSFGNPSLLFFVWLWT